MTSVTLGWLHIVILLGALQGLFLTGALATKRRNRTANRLLAAAMLAFSLSLATSVYHAAGLEHAYPHFFGVGYPLTFLFGPLIYLYALAAADRSRPFYMKDALHIVPFLACLIFGFPTYFQSGPDKLETMREFFSGDVPLWIKFADPLKFVSGIVYTALTIRFVLRHREQVKDSYSSTERVNLQWLLWLCALSAAIWVLATALNLAESSGLTAGFRTDDIVSLAVAVLVCGIGYRGMRQPEVFRYETAEFPVVLKPDISPASPQPTAESESPRYERSGLTEREAAKLKEQLLAVMDKEQPWKNSELTLADLAEKLATTPHKLSEVLNAELEMTFYDFVNGYRVREVQRRIASGEAKALKLLSLALDAGFASKSTFNQVFKKHTGRTPSEFQAA